MVSLLLFSESHPRQPTGPSEPVFLVVSCCQPFIITRHNSWLSKMFNFAEYTCNGHCSTGVPKCSYKELCVASSVFRRHVFVATLRDRWQRCAVTAFDRGRALLKAVIGLRWLSSRRQAETEQKRNGENCTLTRY